MARAVKTLEAEALQLGEKDRAELARVLLLSLEDLQEPTNDEVWAEEAERRYEELRVGSVEAIPNEQVFEQARSQLK